MAFWEEDRSYPLPTLPLKNKFKNRYTGLESFYFYPAFLS